jgi:TRAP-type mannitol/chloroaromatic compound transport system permease large subunit
MAAEARTTNGLDEETVVAIARRLARAFPASVAPVVLAEQTGQHIGTVFATLALLSEHGLAVLVHVGRWRAVDPRQRWRR